jgi:hypothetical protein
MSITVKQVIPGPPSYPSAHGKLDFVISSTNTGQPNFKYVFDVWVGFVKVGTFKVYPDPVTGLGYFNAGKVVRSYLDQYYLSNALAKLTSIDPSGRHEIVFDMKYGEEYGSPVTLYSALTFSDGHRAYNYYNDLYPVGVLHQLSSYVGKPITNRPKVQRVTMNDIGYMPIWNPNADSLTMNVDVYDSAGALSGSNHTTQNFPFSMLGFTPRCINATHAGLIPATTSYYTITVGTEVHTFYLDCYPKYTPYALTFLNRLGGYETAFFRMKSSRSVDIEKKSYGSNDIRVFTGGGGSAGTSPYEAFSSNVLLPAQRNSYVQQKQKMKLSTDFLTDQDFDWLKELVSSPVVYLLAENAGSQYYIPVEPKVTSFEYKRRNVHGLGCLDIDIEIAQNINSQIN